MEDQKQNNVRCHACDDIIPNIIYASDCILCEKCTAKYVELCRDKKEESIDTRLPVETIAGCIEWIVEAMEFVPLNDDAKLILDMLISIQQEHKQPCEMSNQQWEIARREELLTENYVIDHN